MIVSAGAAFGRFREKVCNFAYVKSNVLALLSVRAQSPWSWGNPRPSERRPRPLPVVSLCVVVVVVVVLPLARLGTGHW